MRPQTRPIQIREEPRRIFSLCVLCRRGKIKKGSKPSETFLKPTSKPQTPNAFFSLRSIRFSISEKFIIVSRETLIYLAEIKTDRTAMSDGETPEILDACPRVSGFTKESFSLASRERDLHSSK